MQILKHARRFRLTTTENVQGWLLQIRASSTMVNVRLVDDSPANPPQLLHALPADDAVVV